MRTVFVILLLVGLNFQEGVSQAIESNELRSIPLLKHFESTEYRGGIQNWSMDQDSSGILYLANNDGLLEFDGSAWRLHEVPLCTKVRAVKVDQKNRIFVGGQNQIGYFIFSDKGLEFKSLLDLLPPELRTISETWRIFQHDQKIYINTESQLFVFDENRMKVLTLPGYIGRISKVGKRLLAQFYDLGLYEIVNDEFIPVQGTENLPDIVSIFHQSDKYYYFCFSGQIYQHDEAGVRLLEIPLSLGAVNDVVKLSSDNFAIGTQNNGLYLLGPELNFISHLTKNEGLTDRTIKALYEDNFNNLWVALNNGIDYLQLSLPFSIINDEVGLEGTGYAACKHEGQIYLGTNNGLFIQEKGNSQFHPGKYALVPGSEGQVYNFSVVEEDLILNHDKGGFLIEGSNIQKFHDMGSWKFIETPLPGLILGGDYQGMSFFRKINGTWTKIRGIQNFNESSRVFEYENDSILWMTHGSKGAFRISFDDNMHVKSDIEFFGQENGFPSNIFISVYTLIDKLIFTSEAGIYQFNYDSHSFIPIDFFNKWLGIDHVSEIMSDGNNRIYYTQNQKMGLLMQESFGTYKNETSLFKHINRFINDDLPNISILDEHHILIGAKEGFIKYDPKKEFRINDRFHIILKSLEIKASEDSILSFNPAFIENKELLRNQSVKFHYAAPYFDGFQDLKYSYKLTPLGKGWSQWTSVGEKEYPYLPSGDYTFQVKAKNVYGLESTVSSFSFKVLKPWYLSNWAIIVYFVVGFISVLLLLILQQKKFTTEKSIIHKDKEQALKTKNEEISQISEKSKKEIDRLNSEKLQAEIDLKNDRLTTITMLFMNKNEFIQDIRKRVESYINQDGSKHDLKNLVKTIDKNLSDNDSWDQFAYHFDQVHGDYLKKLSKSHVKLSPREIKLAAFLRMNMSSKEISNLLNITTRSVELARYRLRKKLKLERDQNLVEYLIELDSNKPD